MEHSAYGLSVTLPVPFDTAVADATANPRTDIPVTRFPSDIARYDCRAGAFVPQTRASPR